MSECAHSKAAYRVEDEDGGELTEAVQSHVSEETEGGDERTSTLSVQRKTPHFVPTSQRPSQIFFKPSAFQNSNVDTALLVLTLKMVSPDKCGDAADVFRLGSERRRDRCLGFRQRDADVCGSQGPAVVGAVPTHAHSVAAAKQRFPILYCWFKFIVNN